MDNRSTEKGLVIGISGGTCTGKTTLSNLLLEKLYSRKEPVVLNQDDFYFDEEYTGHVKIEGLNHVNWELPSAFDFPRLRRRIEDLKGEGKYVILEGITIFNDEQTAKLCDVKFFVEIDYETCLERRRNRTYDPPDVEGYFEQVVWPEYLKNLENIANKNEIAFLKGSDSMEENLSAILKRI